MASVISHILQKIINNKGIYKMNLISEYKYISSNLDLKRLEGKKALLIGSSGFIGRYLSKYFDYLKNIGLDFSYTKMDLYLKQDDDGDMICHDICEEVNLDLEYDFVINCAGIASPVKYMKKPIKTMDVSYIGTKNVLNFCLRKKPQSIIMFSSSEVYGTPDFKNIPTRESFVGKIPTMSSRSCYDVGKMVLETLCHNYFDKFNSPVKVIRPFNFYGPYMDLNDRRVLSNWVKKSFHGEALQVYGDGKQTRTFCYIADGILGVLKVMLDGENGEVYNVGNSNPEVSMEELARIFVKHANNKSKFEKIEYPNDYPKEEPERRCPDISKMQDKLGYRPNYSLKYGISKMFEYYKKYNEEV